MNVPPWASAWISDHWFMASMIVLFSVMIAFGSLRIICVNFFKIFHKREITVNINTQGTSATPEQLGDVVRNQVQEQLRNVGWGRSQAPARPRPRTRLQAIDED